MSKTPVPQSSVLTANRLDDGIVVFLDFEGAWSGNLAEAVVAHSPDEVRALEDRGAYDAAHNLVVEPYLIEVREAAGRLTPVRYRERVRAAGPSILDDVPGYEAPAPRLRGEGHGGAVPPARGEGQPHTPAQASAPNPLPVKNRERELLEPLTQAA